MQQPTTESRKTYFAAAILAPIIWGFVSVPVYWLSSYSAESILNWRVIIAFISLGVYISLFRRDRFLSDYYLLKDLSSGKQLKLLLLTVTAAVLIFGNWYAYIYCVNHVSVKAAAFAYMLCPLITATGAYFVLRDPLSKTKKTALFIALIAVSLLASGSLEEVLWSIAIGGIYAAYLIIQRITTGFDKLNLLILQLFICLPLVALVHTYNPSALPTEISFWTIIFAISVVFTVIPLFMSMYALNKTSPATVGVLLYINPIIAFALAGIYFDETFDLYSLLSYSLLAVSVFLYNYKTLRTFKESFTLR